MWDSFFIHALASQMPFGCLLWVWHISRYRRHWVRQTWLLTSESLCLVEGDSKCENSPCLKLAHLPMRAIKQGEMVECGATPPGGEVRKDPLRRWCLSWGLKDGRSHSKTWEKSILFGDLWVQWPGNGTGLACLRNRRKAWVIFICWFCIP